VTGVRWTRAEAEHAAADALARHANETLGSWDYDAKDWTREARAALDELNLPDTFTVVADDETPSGRVAAAIEASRSEVPWLSDDDLADLTDAAAQLAAGVAELQRYVDQVKAAGVDRAEARFLDPTLRYVALHNLHCLQAASPALPARVRKLAEAAERCEVSLTGGGGDR
jgi:hypothetical protein